MEGTRKLIKERFREARVRKFRSLNAFAAAIGKKADTCTAWEAMSRDVIPPTDALPAICRALDISADYLLGLTDEPRPRVPQAAPAIVGNSNGGSNSINTGSGGDCPHCDAVVSTLREAINALAEQLRRNQ